MLELLPEPPDDLPEDFELLEFEEEPLLFFELLPELLLPELSELELFAACVSSASVSASVVASVVACVVVTVVLGELVVSATASFFFEQAENMVVIISTATIIAIMDLICFFILFSPFREIILLSC